MIERRNIFLHGLFLTLRRFPAVLWAYAFNLALALIFTVRLHSQFSSIMDHSLAAQKLTSGFDLGAGAEVVLRLQDGPSAGATGSLSSIPLYLLVYFLLVPGTLFCYQTKTPARLSTLLHQGLLHFWRFARITLLTILISALILGPLVFLQGKWAEHVDKHAVGRHAFFATLIGYILIFLVASILRLYFDLVEVYTVQLGQHLRHNGKPDRRMRRALGPAWRTLRAHFSQAWPVFLFLTLLGAAAVIVTARTSMHMLAQPRVWPTVVLAQLGLFLYLFTRFWQRGAETSLALQNPIFRPSPLPILPVVGKINPIDPLHPNHPITTHTPIPTHETPQPSQPLAQTPAPIPDPIPNPEPPSPSLDEPDPGVFHHDPTKPAQ
ncbi:hypothetical protein RBB79_13175 [Tunturiibacter empetritectus]|uniref:Uncharacterized protein n=2 Tax=Tunturiibacter TaxID=3154218 RepID=A0A852VJE6_9BACT|nr:hypothetical protein [Edaphobacter lichenicola]NYF90554.1 hypothetical protein [Edaphobacter lichenicola]